MIRKLRWKVVGLNMGMVFCVLLAVFAAVYFSSRAVISRNVRQQLQQALQPGSGYELSQPGQEGLPCFVAEVYASGTVRISGNSYYDLTDKAALAEIVTAALMAESGEGVLPAHHLLRLLFRQRLPSAGPTHPCEAQINCALFPGQCQSRKDRHPSHQRPCVRLLPRPTALPVWR